MLWLYIAAFRPVFSLNIEYNTFLRSRQNHPVTGYVPAQSVKFAFLLLHQTTQTVSTLLSYYLIFGIA